MNVSEKFFVRYGCLKTIFRMWCRECLREMSNTYWVRMGFVDNCFKIQKDLFQ